MRGETDHACSVHQAARQLRVTERMVRRWVRGGLLPAQRLPGGGARIPVSAIAALADQHPGLREPVVNFQSEHACFGCGRINPWGVQLKFIAEGEGVRAEFVPGRLREGWTGIVHGGIVATLLDEALGWALFRRQIWAMTARLNITYRRPVLVGQSLTIHGRILRDRGRLVEAAGEVRDMNGITLAEATATFVRVDAETRARLEQYYGVTAAPAAAAR